MSTFKWDPAGHREFRLALARGVLNTCHAVEGASKAITPVHGDPDQGGQFKTFAPGEKPIGGTLRRSQHSVVYIDGKRQFGTGGTDENKNRVPSYATGKGIEGFVGTNVSYAGYVHDGTPKMKPARPYLATAFQQERVHVADYFAAGFRMR